MRHGVEQSLTDAGTHLQNPTVEGFFGILTRRLELEKKYKTYTVNHMKREIDSFIDNYNKLMDYDNKKNEFLNLTQPNQKFVSDFKKIILEKHDSVDNFFGDVTQIHLLKDYCIIDTETTGLNYDVDEIIEMAAVRVRNNKIVDRFQTLIKPKDAKNNPVEKINHITPEMWKDAPTLTEAYPKFRKFIGDDIVIAYNFYFDNRMITANCSHLGFERTRIDNNKRFDLMRVAKYLTGHNFVRLEEFANRYGIKHSQLHRAMDDCLLEYEVFKKVQEVIGGNNLKKNNIC
jgi:DNA polymerase III epsilon subunit family exonuclease